MTETRSTYSHAGAFERQQRRMRQLSGVGIASTLNLRALSGMPIKRETNQLLVQDFTPPQDNLPAWSFRAGACMIEAQS